MNDLATLTTFFGWLTIVNLVVYLISALAIWGMRDFVYDMNAKIFGISREDVARYSFQYVGAFKLLITVFCFAPWLALKIMA